MHTVTYTREATKALLKIEAGQALKIRDKINAYAADPASMANNVKKLKGSKALRLRVDDYRVIFTVTFTSGDNGEMIVLKIGHRREVYD
jgi:mRNA interferase RelE/StbE